MNPIQSKEDFYKIVQALAREDVNKLIAGIPKSNPEMYEEAKMGPKKRKALIKAKREQQKENESIKESPHPKKKVVHKQRTKPVDKVVPSKITRIKREKKQEPRSRIRDKKQEPSTTNIQHETKRTRRIAKANPNKIVKVIPKKQRINNYKPRTPLQSIKKSRINETPEKPHESIKNFSDEESESGEEDSDTEYDRIQIRAVATQTTATSIKQHKKAQQKAKSKNRVLKHYPLKKKRKSARIFHPDGLVSETQISYRYIDKSKKKTPFTAEEGVQTGSEHQRPTVIELDPPVPSRPVVQRNNFLSSRIMEHSKIESPQHARLERERHARKTVSKAERDEMFQALKNKLSAMQSEIHEPQPNVPFEPLLVPEHIEESTNLSEESIPNELSPPPSPEPLIPERVSPPKDATPSPKNTHNELEKLRDRVAKKQDKLDEQEHQLQLKYKEMYGKLNHYDDEMNAIRGRLEDPDSELFSLSNISEILSDDLSSHFSVQSSPQLSKDDVDDVLSPELLAAVYEHRDAQARVNQRKASSIGDICSDISPHVLIEILAESILNDMVDQTANLMDTWCHDIVAEVFQQEFAVVGNHE
mmetsp:Transcript_349/g.635  ORF Transcript_349/g.635 Transcript_349/m.635 type:complete len:588 (+) Transcript_349:30-1793(+)